MAPQLQDPDIPELYQEKRNWRLIELIVASVLLLVIIGFLVWFVFFRDTSSTTPVTAPKNVPAFSDNGTIGPSNSSSTKSNNNKSSNSSASQKKSNSASSSSYSNSTASKSSTAANNSSSSSSKNLTDTGPGDVIALFLGASAVGALAYQVKSRRSLARR